MSVGCDSTRESRGNKGRCEGTKREGDFDLLVRRVRTGDWMK